MQGFPVSAMEDDTALQFLFEEGFEKGKYHLEYVRLVDDVDVLDTKRDGILE